MAYRCVFGIYDYDRHVSRPCGFVSETEAGMKRHQGIHYNAYFPDAAREYEVVRSPRHLDTVQSSLFGDTV